MTKGQTTTAKGIRLKDEVWDWLTELADKRSKTVNEMVVMIIEATMKRNKGDE